MPHYWAKSRREGNDSVPDSSQPLGVFGRLKDAFIRFTPRTAGATPRDTVIAGLGAVLGISLTGVLTSLLVPHAPYLPYIVAPMGASSVLLFAVPSSPLAQPWSVLGGNVVSALVGVAASHAFDDMLLATGVATAFAIMAMSLMRCLHPPGGAVALSAVLLNHTTPGLGYAYALLPVGLNSMILVAIAASFHRFSGHAYPIRHPRPPVSHLGTSDPPPQTRSGFRDEDIDAALADLHETYDISRDDLSLLLHRVELRALGRVHGALTCADVMSKDVVSIEPTARLDAVRHALVSRGLRHLPVVDQAGHCLGVVSLREAMIGRGTAREVMAKARTAGPQTPVVDLIEPLTTPGAHEIMIVDDDLRLRGLVTQTDLIIALTRMTTQAERSRPVSGDE